MTTFILSATEKQLVEDNIKLAYWKAHRWCNALCNFTLLDEFVSCCEFALIKAAHTHDSSRPNKFATYANACMDNQIKAYLRKNIYYAIPLSSITVKEDEAREEMPIEVVANLHVEAYEIEDRLDVKNLLEKLPDREYNIIYMYYFIGYNENEIAEIIQLSQSYISRLKRKGLKTLKSIIESKCG